MARSASEGGLVEIRSGRASPSALTFDQFGLLGLPRQPATLVRLSGAGLLILGVVLVPA